MTFSYTLTLTGSSADHASVVRSAGDAPQNFRTIMFQADTANTHDVFIGGNNQGAGVSSTAYGFLLPKPVTSEPAAPVILSTPSGQSLDLTQFWLIGTASEKVHIFCIP